MSSNKRKFMDALGDDDSDADSDTSSSSEDEAPPMNAAKAGTAKQGSKNALKLEDLEKAGYQAGPSVLFIQAQAQPEPEANWSWSDGSAAKQQEKDESFQDRRATREATTTSVEESAHHTAKMLAYAEKLRTEKKAEKDAKAKQKSLSFKEKEKRKRESGQQSSGKNYVEEEKRIAREAGIYSGFDS